MYVWINRTDTSFLFILSLIIVIWLLYEMNSRRHHIFPKYFWPQLKPYFGKQTMKWQTSWWVINVHIKSKKKSMKKRNLLYLFAHHIYIYIYIYIYILSLKKKPKTGYFSLKKVWLCKINYIELSTRKI